VVCTYGVCRPGPNPSHDGNKDMLFNVEWPRIKRDPEDGNVRQITTPSFADGERQHQGNNLSSKDPIQQLSPEKKPKEIHKPH
jgi:hypothetical protein